jgi:S-formylglutathione hydrolase FrmB
VHAYFPWPLAGTVLTAIVHTGGLQIQGEDDAYDFGSGAGFYVDATKEPWAKGYNMYSYITKELPEALFRSFSQLDSSRVSITGHSMGGHGALTLVRISG